MQLLRTTILFASLVYIVQCVPIALLEQNDGMTMNAAASNATANNNNASSSTTDNAQRQAPVVDTHHVNLVNVSNEGTTLEDGPLASDNRSSSVELPLLEGAKVSMTGSDPTIDTSLPSNNASVALHQNGTLSNDQAFEPKDNSTVDLISLTHGHNVEKVNSSQPLVASLTSKPIAESDDGPKHAFNASKLTAQNVAQTMQTANNQTHSEHLDHLPAQNFVEVQGDSDRDDDFARWLDYELPAILHNVSLHKVDTDTRSVAKPFLAEDETLYSSAGERAFGPSPYETRYRVLGDDQYSFNIPKHWGPYSPYHSSPMFASFQRNRNVPKTCKIKQVHLLHRHGARLPNNVPDFAAWHRDVTSLHASEAGRKATFHGPLRFLSDWSYKLGLDVLTPAGFQEMYDSGIHSHYRYGAMLDSTKLAHKPVVRTLSEPRMLESAQMWTLGFFGSHASEVVDMVVHDSSKPGFNSTLQANEACPAAEKRKIGDTMLEEWVQRYLSRAVHRLQRYVHGGVKLTPEIVFGMQLLCPHETYGLGVSKFCNLFTREEWEGFEYAFDLSFQGNFGFMSPAGRAQGIGWVQELVARMTNDVIATPFTTQNVTLDSNRTTFPLDQTIYADFTHGRQIVATLRALDFIPFATRLSVHRIDHSRNFVLSNIIPHAARLFVEVLECNEEDEAKSGDAHAHYLRFILNEAVLPVSEHQGCGDRKSKETGMCPLGKFVEHVNKVLVPAADYSHACFDVPTNGTHGTDEFKIF